uniref:RNase H type-1 domain-containing protein n=1 Tax=Nicotiana tabacum TaxID=4097 RepID=A0A1S4AI21_TOBAC
MAIDQDVEELLIMIDSDLIIRQAQGEWETQDVKIIPYRQHVEELGKRFKLVEFRYIPHFHNGLADALDTLASMLPYPRNAHIDPLEIQIRERHGYCNTVKIAPNTQPWYHDIKRKILPKGALYQGDIEGNDPEAAVNTDAVK